MKAKSCVFLNQEIKFKSIWQIKMSKIVDFAIASVKIMKLEIFIISVSIFSGIPKVILYIKYRNRSSNIS